MSLRQLDADPSPAIFAPQTSALLVIDMQKDFLYPDGYGAFLGNDVTLLQRVVAPIQAVLARARSLGMVVIHTREGHRADLSDCPPIKLDRWPEGTRIGDMGPMGRILIRGEAGHEIIDELAPAPGEAVIDKPGKSAFYATDLEESLRRQSIHTLIITGVTTDVCCNATTIDANDRGFDAIVLADCVASYSADRHRAALEIIGAQGGIFGRVSDSARLLAALQS
jgi:nicotinamidase-related amidase